jgi:hypothetical protein
VFPHGGGPWPYFQILGLARKDFFVTNSLVYLAFSSVTEKKKRLTTLLLMPRPNKLECLYLSITFQSSLTFAGNIRSLPKKEASERRYNWFGSVFALKFQDLTGKGFQGQTL